MILFRNLMVVWVIGWTIVAYQQFSQSFQKNNILSNNEIRIVHTHFDQSKKWLKESIDKTASMGSMEISTIFPETSDSISLKSFIASIIHTASPLLIESPTLANGADSGLDDL